MKLPGKDFLKKAFLGAAASLTLAGCAIVPYEPAYPDYYPPRRVIVEPVVVLPAPILVVPGRPYYHDRYDHHDRHHGWRR